MTAGIIRDAGPARAGLLRRLVGLAAGSRFDGRAGSGGELWFVIAGRGRLDMGELQGTTLARDTGLWLPPGARYRLHVGQRSGILLDAVALPAVTQASVTQAASATLPAVSRLGDCEIEQTGDRRFRVLLGPGRGCEAATQFVGEIPPGRAPEHVHPYDELVLVLEGEGVLHARGADRALAHGTCVHLPPGRPHCLENTGKTPLMVLGVFHPGGTPAAKAEAAAG